MIIHLSFFISKYLIVRNVYDIIKTNLRSEFKVEKRYNLRGYKQSQKRNILSKNALMSAVKETAHQSADVLRMLKLHIGMGLDADDSTDESMDIQIRIAEIDAEFKEMLKSISSEISIENYDDTKMAELLNEKHCLEQQLSQYEDTKQKRLNAKSRLEEIFDIIDGLKNHPMTYDDKIVRQIIECVVVESKEKIKVVFIGGMEVIKELR